MGSGWTDVRFATRMLWRRPGFAAAVIGMLALGIGISTAIFSVFNGVLLRPLPYPAAERLVQVWEERQGGVRNTVSPLNWMDWREGAESFEGIAVYAYDPLTLTGHGESRRLIGSMVSANFFDVLGVEPALGRRFRPEEDQPERVAIIYRARDVNAGGVEKGGAGDAPVRLPFFEIGEEVVPLGDAGRRRARRVGADVVFECAGVPETVQQSVDWVRRGSPMSGYVSRCSRSNSSSMSSMFLFQICTCMLGLLIHSVSRLFICLSSVL